MSELYTAQITHLCGPIRENDLHDRGDQTAEEKRQRVQWCDGEQEGVDVSSLFSSLINTTMRSRIWLSRPEDGRS